jgi:hypothetical protein
LYVYFMSNVMPFFYLVLFHHLLVLCSCVHIIFNAMPAPILFNSSLSIIGVMVSCLFLSYTIPHPSSQFFYYHLLVLCSWFHFLSNAPPPPGSRFFFIVSWSCVLMLVFYLMQCPPPFFPNIFLLSLSLMSSFCFKLHVTTFFFSQYFFIISWSCVLMFISCLMWCPPWSSLKHLGLMCLFLVWCDLHPSTLVDHYELKCNCFATIWPFFYILALVLIVVCVAIKTPRLTHVYPNVLTWKLW